MSCLTGKYRATVPASLRRTFGVGAGERISRQVSGDAVILSRAARNDDSFEATLTDTLSEWASAEHEAAWCDL